MLVGLQPIYLPNVQAVVALGMCKVCKCTVAPHFWGAPHLTYRAQKNLIMKNYSKL